MTGLTPHPRVKLSRLRDIGWRLWDPVGLMDSGSWDDDANLWFADEYDGYLIAAASQLRAGTPRSDVVDGLVRAETRRMRLGERPDTRQRAEAVVDALLAAEDLWTWPDAMGRFQGD